MNLFKLLGANNSPNFKEHALSIFGHPAGASSI